MKRCSYSVSVYVSWGHIRPYCVTYKCFTDLQGAVHFAMQELYITDRKNIEWKRTQNSIRINNVEDQFLRYCIIRKQQQEKK